MSLISGIQGWSITQYGQSGIAMDWFGLTDPFTQALPLLISNTYSGTLYFQGSLVNPRSGYYNFSGIHMGSVTTNSNATLNMTWNAGVSGWIVSSSPVMDTLQLEIVTFTSSNYTGTYSSGQFLFTNTLFNRYSGVIKVFGDIYNNDEPIPSLAQSTGGSMVSGASYTYAMGYILSGWESDVGATANITLTSGSTAVGLTWATPAGVTQFLVWRWSGGGNNITNPIGKVDLVYASGGSSFTDLGSGLVFGQFRHQTWQNSATAVLATSNTGTYLSPPSARTVSGTAQFNYHTWSLSTNLSGTSLLGPIYLVYHRNDATSLGNTMLQNTTAATTSGSVLATPAVFNNETPGLWYRQVVELGSSGNLSQSGTVTYQVGTPAAYIVFDDVFVVAIS